MRVMALSTVLLSLFILAAPSTSFAAGHLPSLRHLPQNEQSNAPEPAAEIKEFDNQFFSVTLPDGWKSLRAVVPASDRVAAVFGKGDDVKVSLNIFRVPFDNKLLANKEVKSLSKKGMTVSQPVKDGAFYTIDIDDHGTKGKAWFGSSGKLRSHVTIFASDLTEANELLQNFKAEAGLVPEKVE